MYSQVGTPENAERMQQQWDNRLLAIDERLKVFQPPHHHSPSTPDSQVIIGILKYILYNYITICIFMYKYVNGSKSVEVNRKTTNSITYYSSNCSNPIKNMLINHKKVSVITCFPAFYLTLFYGNCVAHYYISWRVLCQIFFNKDINLS